MKLLRTIVIGAGLCVAAWQATHGHQQCGYVVRFAAWLTLLMIPFGMIQIAKPIVCAPSRVCEAVSHLGNAFVVCVLAWHGWTFSALAFALGWIVSGWMFDTRRAAVDRIKLEARTASLNGTKHAENPFHAQRN